MCGPWNSPGPGGGGSHPPLTPLLPRSWKIDHPVIGPWNLLENRLGMAEGRGHRHRGCRGTPPSPTCAQEEQQTSRWPGPGEPGKAVTAWGLRQPREARGAERGRTFP